MRKLSDVHGGNAVRVEHIRPYRSGRHLGRTTRWRVGYAVRTYVSPDGELECWDARSSDFASYEDALDFAKYLQEVEQCIP